MASKHSTHTTDREKRELALFFFSLEPNSSRSDCSYFHRSSDHAETPQSRTRGGRAPNLGKIRRRACLRLIPFPGTGDVLLAPTMISHPLAYVAPNPRHLAPTVERGAPSSGDLLWTGTLFLPGERSQPAAPDGACPDALQGVDDACAASCLADLLGETRISDESPRPTRARTTPRAASSASLTSFTSPASLL